MAAAPPLQASHLLFSSVEGKLATRQTHYQLICVFIGNAKLALSPTSQMSVSVARTRTTSDESDGRSRPLEWLIVSKLTEVSDLLKGMHRGPMATLPIPLSPGSYRPEMEPHPEGYGAPLKGQPYLPSHPESCSPQFPSL